MDFAQFFIDIIIGQDVAGKRPGPAPGKSVLLSYLQMLISVPPVEKAQIKTADFLLPYLFFIRMAVEK